MLEKINTVLDRLERKVSVYTVSLGIGVLLMALARIYIYPAAEAVNESTHVGASKSRDAECQRKSREDCRRR